MRHDNYHQKLRRNEDLNAPERKEFLTTIAEKEKAGTDIFTPEEQQHRTDYRDVIDNLKDPASAESEDAIAEVDDADKTEAQRLVKDHIFDADVSANAKKAVARAFNATSLEDLAANELLVNHLKELDSQGETIDWKHGGASNPTAGIKGYMDENFDVHPQSGIVQGPKVEPEPEAAAGDKQLIPIDSTAGSASSPSNPQEREEIRRQVKAEQTNRLIRSTERKKAEAVPEGDWPDPTPENLRTDKDEIEGEERFKWKGGGNLAKKYGLMHPNGAYTEAGHALLDTVGEHHKDVTDMLWGDDKGEKLRDYIRQAKNKTIESDNDKLRAAAREAGEEVDESKIKPLLKPGEGPRVTESTLKAATMNQTMLTHLLPLLNNDEGNPDEDGHASHDWSENYDPKTGALLEGSEAHSPFNAEHFNYSDSGAGKLTQAILASLVRDAGAGGVHHHAAFLTHQLGSALEGVELNAGESKKDLIERVQELVVESGIDTDDPTKLQDLTDAVGKTITDAGGPSDWQGNGNVPSPLSQIDEGAIDVLSKIGGTPFVGSETHEKLIQRAEDSGLLQHIMDEDEYGYDDITHAKAKLASMDEDKLRKFLGTSNKAMKAKQAKADEETTTGKETRTKGRQAAAKERTTAAQGRQADAEDAEGDEPSSVKGAMKREKMLHRLAGLTGVDTNDPKAMAAFAEEHHEDYYTNNEIRDMVKAAHSLDKNGKSQKQVADKARAANAALANAQIHLDSGRYPSHEDFVKQFEEKNGRKPTDEETKAIHTEHARELMHYWHDNKEAFIGTEAQGKFDAKIQDYLNNGADFKGLSDDLQNMEAQGIDLGDKDARDEYYEKKSYAEKQPQLSAEHHAERLRSALTDGHHDRRTAFDTQTGEAYSGHMRLNEDGNMEVVRSDEAGRDGGEIEHPESSNAPQLQHHKADGEFDEEAQALYQKSHEARQAMSRDDQAHANALENENSEHSGRIKEHQDEHAANVETSTQEYNEAKTRIDEEARTANRSADDAHEAGLKQHTQKHEEWDSEISGQEEAHTKEEKRFADTESKIHKNHETEMGRLDDQAARDHENLEDERSSITPTHADKRKELQEDHEKERAYRQERHDEEIQNARDTFEEQLRDSPDFKDMSQDDPLYQQEIRSQLQSLREQHAEEYEAQTTRQRSEQAGLDIQEDEAHKKLDADHNLIDEQRDDAQRLVGNDTAEALKQNTDDNQAYHDSMVSALNDRRHSGINEEEQRNLDASQAELDDDNSWVAPENTATLRRNQQKHDARVKQIKEDASRQRSQAPLISEGLTRGQRGGVGADGASLLAAERAAHDESHEAGIAGLQSERDSASAEIKDDASGKIESLRSAKAQKDGKSSDTLIAAYKASAQQRDANRAQLEAARPEKVSARTKATEEADTAFRNHMGQVESVRDPIYEDDDPEGDKPENMIQQASNAEGHARASHALQNPELGATSEKKGEAHSDDEEGEDRDGKPQQTRMVTDPVTKEQKQQVWIPGRGKGWVDKDKMNDAMGSNAEAADDTSSHPDGKVVIYPPGHFDAGTHSEVAEDHPEYRPQSPAMVGHGGNLHAVASEHIDPNDPAVAAMGHEDYIANHLAGALQGHDFSAGVHSGIDAAGLGLHTGDHPATKSSKQRRWDQGKESAKKLGSQTASQFAEGEKGATAQADKKVADLTQDAMRQVERLPGGGKAASALRRLGDHIESSSAAASTVSGQTRAFRGATDWLKNQGIGEALAGGMRDARLGRSQAPKKGTFGRYIGESGYKPSLSSEVMRLPGLRQLRSSSMVIDHSLRDQAQSASNVKLLQDHIKEQADKLESQRTGKS